jgi:putative ABC transport system permease protein
MPFAYAASLSDGAASRPEDVHPQDAMTWQFVAASLDSDKGTRENMIFFLCMEPAKVLTMLDGMDEASPQEKRALVEAVRLVEADKRRIIVGKDRLRTMNKKIGERISLYPVNYTNLQLDECEIAGTFPDGRYNQTAMMSRDRLNDALDLYKRKHGKPHHMTSKTLNLVFLRVPDSAAFSRVAEQIETSSLYTNPPVKCETASSGVASFLDGYRTLIWGMRWVLVPALLTSMALVIAVAISISVRERRTEMAVLKVLGFGPNQIMALVLGEALLVGCGSGLFSSVATYLVIDHLLGGLKFPIAFFPAFFVPVGALWWGPALGSLTALLGSFVPAWSARSVKVAEVFAKTT